jgi:hypothetical protein
MRFSILVFLFVLFATPFASASEPPTTTWKPKGEMIVGGAFGFAASYGFALLIRGSVDECFGDTLCLHAKRNLLIPFAGPFIHAVEYATTPLPPQSDDPASALMSERGTRWFLTGLLALDGAVQVGSAILVVAGLSHRVKPEATAITPVLRPTYVGIQGTF